MEGISRSLSWASTQLGKAKDAIQGKLSSASGTLAIKEIKLRTLDAPSGLKPFINVARGVVLMTHAIFSDISLGLVGKRTLKDIGEGAAVMISLQSMKHAAERASRASGEALTKLSEKLRDG